MQLSSELKRLYPGFTFEIIPIVLGATGLVLSNLWKNIEKIGVKNIKDTMLKCQHMALLGTVKAELEWRALRQSSTTSSS